MHHALILEAMIFAIHYFGTTSPWICQATPNQADIDVPNVNFADVWFYLIL